MSKIFLLSQNEKWKEVGICEAFPFVKEKGHIVSFVGAGGKTSLMFHLAKICSDMGKRVLVSTTTHIMRPKDGSFARNEKEIWERWRHGEIAVVGREVSEEKLAMLSLEELENDMRCADIVFLEADGSKRYPLKVPIAKEPVLLPQSDIVIAVAGLSSLGRTLEEGCFRFAEAEKILHKSKEEPILEEDIAHILTSENGSRKNVGDREYYIVLNQCDNEEKKRSAEYIEQQVRRQGVEHRIATCLLEEEMEGFTHFNEDGNAIMVDVHQKEDTYRIAKAEGTIHVNEEVYRAISAHTVKKGDVLGVARIAGIMAAKKNSELIPLCHNIVLSNCTIDFDLRPEDFSVHAVCTVSCTGKTGVEMEALTGVSVALLTIYDMCKALDRTMEINDIRLLEKDGGKSGHYIR